MILEFKTSGTALAVSEEKDKKLTAGMAGMARARFITDPLWAGLVMTAVFQKDRKVILSPLTNGCCDIPAEMTATCGTLRVGLFGTDGERTLPSVFAAVRVYPAVPTDGEAAENYTPSLYEQFAVKFARVENMTVSAEAGESAAVTAADKDGALHLTFTLPKGDKGEQGDKGEKGDKGADGRDGVDGKDYYITEEDYAVIANYTEEKAVARILYIDVESGGLCKSSTGSVDLYFGDWDLDLLSSTEYRLGCLQGYHYIAVWGEKMLPLTCTFEGDRCRFTAYDAETDTLLVGEYVQDALAATFTVIENYMLAKFDAAIAGGAW